MFTYEFVYIITNLLYIFITDKFFKIFFLENRCNKTLKNISYVLYFLTLSGLVFVTRLPIVLFVVNMFFLLLTSMSYQSSFQKKIYVISFIYSIGAVVELIAVAIVGYFQFSIFENIDFEHIPTLIVMRLFSFVIVHLIGKYKHSFEKDFAIPKTYYISFLIILFGTLYLFSCQLESDITISNVVISGFVLIAVNLTMILIDEKIYNSIILENESERLKQHNESLQKQMELITQSNEKIRLLKHDFKDHLFMLSSLYTSNQVEKIQEYTDKLLCGLENDAVSNSNNFVIDSILNFKLSNLDHSDVELSLDINVPIAIDILAHDLTSVLSNLLDNAIDGCMKSVKKQLDIKIDVQYGNLIIVITNSYDGKIIIENGEFKTTKIFQSNHGLGLRSVKNTLSKHDGELTIDYTSDTFCTSVIIPY